MGSTTSTPDQAVSGQADSQTECIFLYGNLCIDHVYDCASFPAEDSGQRALAARRSLGGNGANSSRILAQLKGSCTKICLMGAVPQRKEADTAFTLATLEASGVDSAFLEEVGGDGMPTSFALTSRETGSRTIVSTRNSVREMGFEHFTAAASKVFANGYTGGKPCWCHMECRQAPEMMLKMVEAWQHEAELQDAPSRVSFEVEKPTIDPEKVLPILKRCDYCFFSQNFAEQHHDALVLSTNPTLEVKVDPDAKAKLQPPGPKEEKTESSAEVHKALRFLRALSKRAGASKGLWMCTWGEHGAFALDVSTDQAFYEPAHLQERVVDSVGAGDTFNAGFIHATHSGADPAKALHFACELAGLKVAQVGFEGLSERLSPGILL